MIPDRYSVADVDGVMCVKWETTDWSAPQIVTNYWPTAIRSRDAVRFFFDENCYDPCLLDALTCKRSMPGEFYIGIKDGYAGTHKGQNVSLVNGGLTKSIKTETREAPRPKVRKGILLYWSDGVWVKHLKRGRENINPLDVKG